MIKLSNVSVAFAERKVLKSVSFELTKGKIYGLIGHSGEGKSTLLKSMAGFQAIDEGEIFFNGHLLPPSQSLLIPGFRSISMVHQGYRLNLYATTEQNIREKLVALPRRTQDKFIKDLLEIVDLEPQMHQTAITLSGGEQQRLGIICALAEENEVLLLDEPFVHLHGPMKHRLVTYIKQLNEIRGTTIVFASHNGEELINVCEKIIVLKNGTIRRIASPQKLYYYPKDLYEAEFFGHLNRVNIDGKAVWFRPDEFSLNQGDLSLAVNFVREEWHGMYNYSFFETKDKRTVLLINFEPLNEIKRIFIKKK